MRVIDWPDAAVRGAAAPGATSSSSTGPNRRCAGPAVARADRRSGPPARRRRRGHARRDARAGVAPPARSRPRTATQRSLAQEVGPLRPDYAGPTGTQTIVQRALGDGRASRASGCGSRCRSTSRVHRRRPRSARCWRGWPSCTASTSTSARSTRAVRGVLGTRRRRARGPPRRARRSSTGSIARHRRVDGRRARRRDRALPAFPIRRSRANLRETMSQYVSRSMRSRCRRSAPTSWSSASRTAPARCRRCRASRRSSCCGRPTTATSFLVYTRWRSQEDFDAWLNSQAFQHGHKRSTAARARSGTGSELWSFDVVQHEEASRAA